MEMMSIEKVKNKISHLLNVTVENGATENEAYMAMLKARELMAKYDISIAETSITEKDEIIESSTETSNDVWKESLAGLVANNFGCKVFKACNRIVFYGYERHADTANEVFKFLYTFGRKRASEICKTYKQHGRSVKGIKNQFYIGFLHGIKSAFDEQTRTLAIIVPDEVETAYKSRSKDFESSRTVIRYRKNSDVYDSGYSSGREATARKQLNAN